MSLWRQLLIRREQLALRLREVWNRMGFHCFQKPRHVAATVGQDVSFYVPVTGGVGSLTIGDNCALGCPGAYQLGNGGIHLQTRAVAAEIVIGRRTNFNNNTAFVAMQSIRVGEYCRIGDGVVVMDCDFHEIPAATRDRSVGPIEPVTIGNRVWIGSRVMILKGVTIGDNCVIGAMSLVTKSIPANSIAAGIPAKVIRTLE